MPKVYGLKRKKPPIDGYDFEVRVCPCCGKSFAIAPFHQYAWRYKKHKDECFHHNVFVCSYSCDRKIDDGEMNEWLLKKKSQV